MRFIVLMSEKKESISFKEYVLRITKRLGVWEKLKSEVKLESMELFLQQSYLVVRSEGDQMPIDITDPFEVANQYPDMIEQDKYGIQYLGQIQEYKRTKSNEVAQNMRSIDCDKLRIKGHTVELRFPTVNMNFIRRIKRSSYVDKNETLMSDVSIRVVLDVD